MPAAYDGTDIIMSAANNKVPGHPLEIFDFVSGSGSYIIFAKQMHHIVAGDTSFHLAPSPLLCYNTHRRWYYETK